MSTEHKWTQALATWSDHLDAQTHYPKESAVNSNLIPFQSRLSVDKATAETQLALYADLDVRTLTEREKKTLAIYDAVVAGDIVIDLDDVLARQVPLYRELPKVTVAPASASQVTFIRERTQTRAQRRQSERRATIHRQFVADGWSMQLPDREYRISWENVEEYEAIANLPSILPTVRPQVEQGDLLLWEPVWTDVSMNEVRADRRRDPDPALLRPLGNGLCRVIAAWDLTPIEIAVLSS